ncbi:MAG: serine/threonine-protein phosphatase [Bacteroidales bacterium]|nr:serine/threonine-protein phosphatase [Bacteroidales bacterium]
MKRIARLIFLLIVLSAPQSIFAQWAERDLPRLYDELKASQNSNDTSKMISNYINLANAYQLLNIPDSSFYYNTSALKISILKRDTAAMSGCYTNLGAETFNRGLYRLSEEYLSKAVHLDSITGNERQLALNLSFLGLVYGIQYIDNPDDTTFRDKAMDKVKKTLHLNGDVFSRFNAYYAATQYYMWQKMDDSTTLYYQKFCEAAPYTPFLPMIVSLDVDYMIYFKQYHKALEYLQKNVSSFQQSKISMRFYYEKLTYVYEMLGDYKNAHNANTEQFRLQREISDDNTTRAIANAEAQKAAEVERIKLEESEKIFAAEKKHLKTISISLGFGLGLVVLIVALFYRMWKIKRNANKILSEKNDLLSQQKTEILSSIRYAERIQRAAIPSQNEVLGLFPDSFIYYQPRDIVSGDYYWTVKCGKFSVMVTADCTGHGIPGAFLSMLGISSLKEFLATEHDAEFPGTVLDRMRSFIKATLISKTDETVDDGMDMTICSFDFENMKLHYALANQSAYIIRNGESIKLKGDRMPVGRYLAEKEHFQTLSVNLCKGDTVYMFSDGFQDQLGGEDSDFGHKFMSKNLVTLLAEISSEPMESQKESIRKAFNSWRNNRSQTDDVTLVGIRV